MVDELKYYKITFFGYAKQSGRAVANHSKHRENCAGIIPYREKCPLQRMPDSNAVLRGRESTDREGSSEF